MRSAKKDANKEKKGKGKGNRNKKNTKEKNSGDDETAKATRKSRAKPKQSQEEKKIAPKKAARKPAGSRKSKSRKARFDELDLDVTQDLVQQDEIADWVWDMNVKYNAEFDEFKKSVRLALSNFDYFRHNIYWKTFKCGLTMFLQDGTKKDVATFYFSDDQRGLATAIACADYVVAWTWQCWQFVLVGDITISENNNYHLHYICLAG